MPGMGAHDGRNTQLRRARRSRGEARATLQLNALTVLNVRTNWLPAPPGEFSLYMRAYWPDASWQKVDGRPRPSNPRNLDKGVRRLFEDSRRLDVRIG